MVRLKGCLKVFLYQYLALFQFHSGTIKSRRAESLLILLEKFQFHSGTIKRQQRQAVRLAS